jgi:predicted phage-related endonuclease
MLTEMQMETIRKPLTTRRIGGSDIGKLLGLSRYGNAADVYLRIVEGIEDEWNPRMERGAAVEPLLRAYSQRTLGIELEDSDSDYHDCAAYEFARAQIDDIARLQGFPVVVDYKSQSRWMKGWGAEWTDEIPPAIHCQVAWEMLCADRDLALVITGFGEDVQDTGDFVLQHVVPYQVERDGPFESLLVQTAREFWEQHVLRRVPPSMKPLGKKAKR